MFVIAARCWKDFNIYDFKPHCSVSSCIGKSSNSGLTISLYKRCPEQLQEAILNDMLLLQNLENCSEIYISLHSNVEFGCHLKSNRVKQFGSSINIHY